VTAISGLGGVGKSAIVRELLRQLHRLRFYRRGIFWLGGDSATALQKGYRDMADELGIRADGTRQNEARDAVFRWMRLNDRWLLVLDNVDEPEAVKEYLPPRGGLRGHVLITTRAGEYRLRGVDCGVLGSRRDTCVVVDCLDTEASLDLLFRLCDRDASSLSPDEFDAARQLCTIELGGLPLAIEQAAAVVRETVAATDVPFRAFLEQYRDESTTLFAERAAPNPVAEWRDWLHDKGVDDVVVDALAEYGVQKLDDLRGLSTERRRLDRALTSSMISDEQRTAAWGAISGGGGVPVADDKSRRSVRTTWELSMRSLNREQQTMVRLLCNLGADNVPVDAIAACVTAIPRDSGLWLDGADAMVAGACLDVLRALSDKSLMTWTPSSSAVSMHRLLQTMVWDAAPATERETLACACMTGLANSLGPWVERVDEEGLAADTSMVSWLPHAHAMLDKRRGLCEGAAGLEPAIRLTACTAAGMKRVNQLDRAQELYSRLLHLLRLRLGDVDAADVAVALRNRANVLFRRGNRNDADESIRLHRDALDMYKRMRGDVDDADVAKSMSMLGRVLLKARHGVDLDEVHRLLVDSLESGVCLTTVTTTRWRRRSATWLRCCPPASVCRSRQHTIATRWRCCDVYTSIGTTNLLPRR
jgi:hypothetical protein